VLVVLTVVVLPVVDVLLVVVEVDVSYIIIKGYYLCHIKDEDS
jgi:hypothetical protein